MIFFFFFLKLSPFKCGISLDVILHELKCFRDDHDHQRGSKPSEAAYRIGEAIYTETTVESLGSEDCCCSRNPNSVAWKQLSDY